MTKVCFKCLVELPLSEFYKHSQMSDGHLNKCKACTKADVSKNRSSHLEYYRAYDKQRFSSDNRKASWSERRKRWRAANPEKYKAHTLVNNALRDGRLFKEPCVKCGSLNAEAHHEDYSKPLEVIWFCRKCHLKEHGNYIEIEE